MRASSSDSNSKRLVSMRSASVRSGSTLFFSVDNSLRTLKRASRVARIAIRNVRGTIKDISEGQSEHEKR